MGGQSREIFHGGDRRLTLVSYKPLGRNHGELVGMRDGFQSYAVRLRSLDPVVEVLVGS